MPCRLPVDLHTFQGILYTKGRYFFMAKSFNYRKYYKDYYGIDFDSNYVVTRSHTETLLLLLMKETYNSDSLSSKILLWVLKLFRYILKEL